MIPLTPNSKTNHVSSLGFLITTQTKTHETKTTNPLTLLLHHETTHLPNSLRLHPTPIQQKKTRKRSINSPTMASVNHMLHPVHHRTLLVPKVPTFLKKTQLGYSFRYPGSRARPVSALVATESEAKTITQPQDSGEVDLFACPVCFEPLIRKGPSGFNLPAIYRSGFKCIKCNKSYSSKNIYLDLTLIAGAKEYVEVQPSRTELFRSPLVSFLYERGWRQNFNLSGFPGPDEEFNMAQEYFKPAEGGTLVDVSCGSGLFTRKFAKSGSYSKVIALDFSENMLRQTYDFIKTDDTILSSNLSLVRADVSRLPFPSGSIDAVHAGAALHCWPSPSNAIAEINRVLRSGGVFVGTTFLRLTSSTPAILRPFIQRNVGNYNNLTEEEIEDLIKSCGFTNYSCKVQQAFIMFSAQKP